MPNAQNQVLIHIDANESNEKTETLFNLEKKSKSLECVGMWPFMMGRCSRMEPKIIRYANAVLDTKLNESYEENDRHELHNRIANIEQKMLEISEKLSSLLEK